MSIRLGQGPFPPIAQESVCRDEELWHDPCDGDFTGLAGAGELIVFRLEIRVIVF